jgi:type I restriction enzyme R subunit
VIQDKTDANPLAGTGVAIREFTLVTGRADYVLYVDGKIVGVIEAKREGASLAGALAGTSGTRRACSRNTRWRCGAARSPSSSATPPPAPRRSSCFLNRVDPDARSREVFAFHRPETLAAWTRHADRTRPTIHCSAFRST